MTISLALSFKAFLLGLLLAAPIGPIAILCIRRALMGGFWSGLSVGMGAVTADMIYAGISLFGITAIAHVIITCNWWFHMLGALFLLYIAVKIALSPAPEQPHSTKGRAHTYLKDYFTTTLLTLSNPMTIITFIAAFAGLELTCSASYLEAAVLTLIVGLGSGLWHVFLVSLVTAARRYMTHTFMNWINKITGIVLAGFALWLLFKP